MKKRVQFIELFKTVAIILCIISGAILLIYTLAEKTTPDIFFTQSKLSVLVIFILLVAANLYIGRKILITGLSIITIIILAFVMSSFLIFPIITIFQFSNATCLFSFIVSFVLSATWQLYLLKLRESALQQVA